MRYDAAQIEYLAAEYVLGTLQGAARRRFDRLIAERADVRLKVWRWERHLNGMVAGLAPRPPRPRVWKNIRQRIGVLPTTKLTFAERWRGAWLAVPAAIAAGWLAILLWPAITSDRMAVFADQDADTLWVVSADIDRGLLNTEALSVPTLDGNATYELWVLPDAGPPVSLGLLPTNIGSTQTTLSDDVLTVLRSSSRLAISLEPSGGSPTGSPTGPVVYQAPLVSI